MKQRLSTGAALRRLHPVLLLLTLWLAPPAWGQLLMDLNLEEASGRELMNAVYDRHRRYPYVFEEQSMVLIDRYGRRETRRLTRYSRVEPNGNFRILLLFQYPLDVQGVALVATFFPDGSSDRKVFLPALGHYMISNNSLSAGLGNARDEHFLGTDFSIENITGETLDHYRYERQPDILIDDTDYFLVEAYRRNDPIDTARPIRRHYILKDGLFITRTDHLDETGHQVKRQTHHDLTAVHGDTWRANMMLMENVVDTHQTIIKIDRRIFSPDYVPDVVFTPEWIFANAPVLEVPTEPPADEDEMSTAEPPGGEA